MDVKEILQWASIACLLGAIYCLIRVLLLNRKIRGIIEVALEELDHQAIEDEEEE